MMRTTQSALLGRLDLSASGVRSSFQAILIALPSLAVGWVGSARVFLGHDATADQLIPLIVGLGIADLVAWLFPLIVFAPLLSAMGLAARYPAFVIATNWAGVIFAFIALPIGIGRVLAPTAAEFDTLLILTTLVVTCTLYWRLLRAVLGVGGGQAAAYVLVSLLVGMMSGYATASMLGLSLE
ncbi:hypothetical protein [Notoacmeibacter sp. MSK16QG-6]|uniref:hypothetical protein n=1 Tax=Notoacmeibacter sp. MSK16QG-6 TaxID=2957982 RepID=UPI0020A01701|nr:hypothetical protein [Notoacmeibacter sp. MSK16QG-6]